MIARIQQFTLMDDDFMTRFFDGENACVQVVLQVLLEKPDLTVTEAIGQKVIKNLQGRSVRLDVLAQRAKYLKENDKGVSHMCKIMEDFAKEEREEAKAERDIETASRLLAKGEMSEEKIKDFFGFTDAQMNLVKQEVVVAG